MSTLFPYTRQLDGKKCWKMWWAEGGSLAQTSKDLFELEGVSSNRTGKKFSSMAVRYAAWLWALDNLDEAYQDVKFKLSKLGRILSEEEWKKAVAEAIRSVYSQSPDKGKRIIAQHGLQKYDPKP